jgi:hypothetical protein
VDEWVTILLGIKELLVSNPRPEFDCPDGGLSQFFSVPPGKFEDSAVGLATS